MTGVRRRELKKTEEFKRSGIFVTDCRIFATKLGTGTTKSGTGAAEEPASEKEKRRSHNRQRMSKGDRGTGGPRRQRQGQLTVSSNIDVRWRLTRTSV